MCRWFLLLAVPQLLAGGGAEASPTDQQPHASGCPNGMVESSRWKPGDLVGFTLKLIDPEEVLEFSFAKRDVATSAGKKGSWVTAPVFAWRIQKDGVAVLRDEGRTYFKPRKRCAGDHRLLVDVNGERKDFVVSKD